MLQNSGGRELSVWQQSEKMATRMLGAARIRGACDDAVKGLQSCHL